MRRSVAVLLILGVADGRGTAQQPVPVTPARATNVAPASAEPSKREVERRRRIVDIVTAPTVDREVSWLIRSQALGTTVLTSIDEQTSYLVVRRTVSSRPEVHQRWDDLIIVRSGEGAVEVGDSLTGSTMRIPGERIGGRIVKSFPIPLHTGDIVRIPATVPHAFTVSGKEPLEYLVVKQLRQTRPRRWLNEP